MLTKQERLQKPETEFQKVLQETFARFTGLSETKPISLEEFEACIDTLTKLWQVPKGSPKNMDKSTLPELVQKSIREKLDWIDGRFSVAIENFENEIERGLTLLQSRRMLREQIWFYCTTSLLHKRLLTLLINALDRAKPKSITTNQLNLLRGKIDLLAVRELTSKMLEEAEDALLIIE